MSALPVTCSLIFTSEPSPLGRFWGDLSTLLFDLEREFIQITPGPTLARFDRLYDRIEVCTLLRHGVLPLCGCEKLLRENL